jgi:DNA-binding XRE family transcriptional regulator
MASLSYQERSLYGSLAAELAVYIPYFVLHRQNSLNKVVGMIVSIIVLQIILQSIIAAISRHRVRDERDRVIELRGYRMGYLTLVACHVRPLAIGQPFHRPALPQRLLRHGRAVRPCEDDRAVGGLPESTLMGAIRNTIRDLRGEHSLTQQELAERIGITRQTVIAIEQDRYSPSLETAFKIAQVFAVPLEQVFQYKPNARR